MMQLMLLIRPILPEDKPLLVAGLRALSPESAMKRFLSPKVSFSAAELRYLTEVDQRDHIAYVHIKDGIWKDGGTQFTFPGEGEGDVKRIVADLAARGYQGGLSIEPHLGAVYHDPKSGDANPSAYATYVEYGKRLEQIVKNARQPAPTAAI